MDIPLESSPSSESFGPARISVTCPNNVWTTSQFMDIMGRLLSADNSLPPEAFESPIGLGVMQTLVLRSLLHQAAPAGNS